VSVGDGSLVVRGGPSLELLSSSGGSGELFGGSVDLPVPAGSQQEYVLAGFTVDPQGRLVVVRTSYFPEAENPSPLDLDAAVFRPAAIQISRLLPDGSPDPGFGQGGVVETDLGLPAPLATDRRGRVGSRPALRATGITIDPQGRLVVTGEAAIGLRLGCHFGEELRPSVDSGGFVARFEEDGSLDTTFGGRGVIGGRRLAELPLYPESVREPVADGSGITYRSATSRECSAGRSRNGIAQLAQTGKARGAFGDGGGIEGPFTALAGGPAGSVFALRYIRGIRGEKEKAKVLKVAPDGKPSRSWGQGGSATIRTGRVVSGGFDSLAVDHRGRLLVGGSFGPLRARSMALMRLSALGVQEKHFGPRGELVTPVPGLGGRGALFFDPQGRLISVHAQTGAPDVPAGVVVARYLLSN
jgi:hypothetical protein